MAHRSVWKPVTKRDTKSRILVQHRHTADEIGIRAYARKLEIKPGTLSRYLEGNYEPKNEIIRDRLELPKLGTGRICPVHHRVCDTIHRLRKPANHWRDMPVEQLKQVIDNRKEYTEHEAELSVLFYARR